MFWSVFVALCNGLFFASSWQMLTVIIILYLGLTEREINWVHTIITYNFYDNRWLYVISIHNFYDNCLGVCN